MGQAVKKYSEHYTIEEWKHWQDRWELINGFPYCMSPAPSIEHQNVNGAIYSQLREKLKKCAKCKAYLPIDWQISFDTIVQPDISVLCKKVSGQKIKIPPTIIFEILSPSTKIKDRTEKFDLYESQKVKYYILVDPEKKSFEIYKLVNSAYKKQISLNLFRFEINECSFEFDFSGIWS